MTTLLKLVEISKSFAGVQALKRVSFDLRPGEVHALVGENGAGKSTLIKIITGAHKRDSGILEIDGRSVDQFDPAAAKAFGIAAIYQQPALFPDLSVTENLAMGVEPARIWRRVGWKKRREQARQLLNRIGAEIDVESEIRHLTMPEQQLVEIARAVGSHCRILIMDEPTASLSDQEVENLFRVIRELKKEGVGIIYISHRLEELPRIADRVTALRDGQCVATKNATDVTRSELIRLMVGRDLSSIFPKSPVKKGELRLELRAVGSTDENIGDISLQVHAGEILGVAGLIGSGRTELARVLFGLAPADSGSIFVAGKIVRIKNPTEAIDLGIAYVPEDRRRHGVVLGMTVRANLSMAILKKISRFGLISRKREQAITSRYVTQLGVKTRSIEVDVSELSGGNQQKIALGRWLATEPTILILDEPTQGIDVGAKAEIHALMSKLAENGLAIIMISSELPEILGMSDRIAVMHQGTLAGILDRDQATEESILELALGHRSKIGAAS